jgi:hypothetical protein
MRSYIEIASTECRLAVGFALKRFFDSTRFSVVEIESFCGLKDGRNAASAKITETEFGLARLSYIQVVKCYLINRFHIRKRHCSGTQIRYFSLLQ